VGDKPDHTRTQETDFAALWSSDGVTRSLAATGASLPADLPFLFSAGQRFGPYLIVRPLGKGGMGQVYEAEEEDSGRRVAIKLLSRGLGDGEERERFLREGQLAASLSHPNCVYVFGTSEVQGFPVIAMELAPSGTLKDLVDPARPMPVATAVDAMLQVVAGLEAAAAIGILHRDVKPSNCFVDRDGRVMVGDFGLSIASAGVAAPDRGILGTPGFASPEQLSGRPLDLRSDIYSVGATLYYLLTGRTPFDTSDLQSMITRIGGETAPAVTIARPDLPGRFGSVLAKCLAVKPADRPASYAALRAALEPFRTMTIVPAPLARRFFAGFIDSLAASLPMIPVNLLLGSQLLALERDGHVLLLTVPPVLVSLLYYSFFEGAFGCAAGKAALNLRVVDETGHPPGIKRALFRAFAFIAPTQIIIQGVSYGFLRTFVTAATSADPAAASAVGQLALLMTFVSLALLFLPARRRNGFAAFHDRASRTRVVIRPSAIEAREADRARAAKPEAGPSGAARIGPYVVTDAVLESARGITAVTVVDGYDDRLKRWVWIELLPPNTPPVPPWRRDLNRPGRARWISGRRAATECWDAYERIDGQALADVIAMPQPWSRVRHWVADLAHEIAAASRDGSTALLRHDRVWIAHDDRARLLDWTPRPQEEAGTESSPQLFLYALAAGSLTGTSPAIAATRPPGTPLPGSAHTLLMSLSAGTAGTPDAIAERSEALLRDAAAFPRNRRLLQLILCAAVPVVMVASVFTVLRMQLRARNADPQEFALKACLGRLGSIDRKKEADLTAQDREQRELLEVYIAARLRGPAEETASYARAFPAVANVQKDYRLAERALRNHPQPSEALVKRAEPVVERVIAANTASLEALNRPRSMAGVLGLIAGGSIAFVAMLGFIGAVFTGSGFTLRGFGAMLVTRKGVPISRWRAVVRAAITWSPLVLWFVIMSAGTRAEATTVTVAVAYAIFVAIFVAGGIYAWRHPARGIQDRLAGTWIVPR